MDIPQWDQAHEIFNLATPIVLKFFLFVSLVFITHQAVKRICRRFEKRSDLLAQSICLFKVPSVIIIDTLLALSLFNNLFGDLQLIVPVSSRSVLKMVALLSVSWYLYNLINVFEKGFLKSKF